MMMLSNTVSLSEATKSSTAIRLGIDNAPPPDVIERMKVTSSRIIDHVKQKFPKAVVSSFYRSPTLNKKIGGAKNSQHVTGEAVDLDSPDNVDNLAIFNFIRENMVFDQLLLEHPEPDGTPNWVHCSCKEVNNRNQILVILKDKTIPYGEWIIGQV